MASVSSLTTLILIVITVSHVRSQSIGKCGPEESAKFDQVSASLTVIGNPNGTFPRNLKEATAWCSTAKESVKFIKDFSKNCLDSLSRQVASLIAYGVGKHQKKVCKSSKARQEAGTKLRCLNSNYQNINHQMEKYIDDYQRTIKLGYKEKLVGLCCSFHVFNQRTKVEVEKSCEADHAKYFFAYIKAFSSDAIDLLCNSYSPENSACKSLILPPKEPGMKRTLSFLPPLLVSLSNI